MTLMTPDRRPVAIVSADLRPVRGRAGLRSNEWHGVLAWINPEESGQPYDGQPVHLTNPLFVIADRGMDEVLEACQAATVAGYVPPVPPREEAFKRESSDADSQPTGDAGLDAPDGTLLHQAVRLTDGRRGLVIEEHDASKGLVDVMLETGELAERVRVAEVVNDESPTDGEESTSESQASNRRGEESAIAERKDGVSPDVPNRRGRGKGR